MSSEQDARARAHALLGDACEGYTAPGEHTGLCDGVARLEAELAALREKLDAANARADGARAAALREAAKLCRDKGVWYDARNLDDEAFVLKAMAEKLEALAANPQTTEEGPCESK